MQIATLTTASPSDAGAPSAIPTTPTNVTGSLDNAAFETAQTITPTGTETIGRNTFVTVDLSQAGIDQATGATQDLPTGTGDNPATPAVDGGLAGGALAGAAAGAVAGAVAGGPVGSSGILGGGSFGSFGSAGGASGGSPVVLDLSGKGIKINPLSTSNMFFDMKNSGHQQHTAWAGAGNGVLVYDPSGGPVTQANQVNFRLWDPGAKTDMQALEHVFDTNHDGKLDSSDASWNNFRILVTNADGTTTLETLAQAGVTSINLVPNSFHQTFTDGSSIDGETTFTKSNGTTGTAATMTFANDGADYIVQQTVAHNSDGSTTLTNAAFNTDGTLAQTIATTTTANGLTKTTVISDGSGIVVRTDTDATVVNSDGSTTETLSCLNGSGTLLYKFVTTTSADGKTVTINRDPNGAGFTAQQEVDKTNTDGSTSVSVSNLTRNGSLINRTVSSVSADGLTRTVAVDSTGNAINDLTETDATTVDAGGNRTETITDKNSDGSIRDKTVTVTSANGLNITKSVDGAGSGIFNLISTTAVVNNADSSTTRTDTNTANNGTKLGQTVTTVSADGLTTTTKTDAAGSGTFNWTQTDQTVVDASGNRTRTISMACTNGNVYAKQVVVHNADGKTGSVSNYVDFGSGLALTRSRVITLNSSGSLVNTVTTFAPNGTETGQTIITTTANGLSATTQVDLTGTGVFCHTITSTTVKNADGSSTVTQAETAPNGALMGKTVTTASANGLSATTQIDHTGSGTFDTNVSDVTVNNSDGSITRNITTTSANSTLLGKQIINTSADRSTVTTTTQNGDGQTIQVNTAVTAPTGVTTDTLQNLNPNGSLLNETVTTASANGLSVTIQTDASGAVNTFNLTTTDNTVINANGSRIETVTDTSSNGTQIDQTVTTVSANGLSKTTTVNADGKVDYTTTDNTVLNTDGSATETVTKKSNNGTVIGSTITTASGNGLSVTTQIDENGDGVIDITRTDVTVINANGSKTETVTDVNSPSGSLRDQTVTTTNASGTNMSIARDTTGNGTNNQTETIATAANGSVVDTVSNFAANGTLIDQTVTTTSGNGLTRAVQTDLNGDGVFDLTQTAAKAYNSDGSTTVITTNMGGTTATAITVVTTAANGLSSTTLFENGSGTVLDRRTDTKVINADGSTTETVADFSTNNTLVDQTVTTVSSDRKTTTITGNNNGGSVNNQVETIAQQADGSIVDTVSDFSSTGALIAKTVKTTAANGLSWTLTQDQNGDGIVDNTQSDTIVLNADGSTTETYKDSNPSTLNTNGGYTDSTTAVTTRSANGFNITTVITGNDQDLTDNNTLTDNTVINADGSKTETRAIVGAIDNFGHTAAWDTETITTSANGLSQTTTLQDFGNGPTIDIYADAVVIGLDGGKTETLTVPNPDGSVFEKDVTTTSANGLSVSLQSQRNGASSFNHFETGVTNADGSVTDTVSDTNASGVTTDEVITTTSANGLSKTVQIEPDGGGVVEQTLSDVTTLNADGSTTLTQSVLNGNGTLRSKEVRTTSANGLNITTTYDVNGDGIVDETTTDNTVLNADGSKTETVTTNYASGTQKSQSVTTTSANGRNVNTSLTLNGFASVTDNVSISASGAKTETISNFDGSGTLLTTTVTTTSADGRNIIVDHENSSGQITSVEQTLVQGGMNGSYEWIETDSLGNFVAENAHIIDANGADGFNLWFAGQASPMSFDMTLSQEATLFAQVKRLYSTLVDRAPTSAESQTWFQFYGSSGLNLSSLANAILSSTEFSQKYGTLTNAEFVEQIYQNALGRNATTSELQNWLTQLSSGAVTQAGLVIALSESAEHVADGNVYQVTNNTYNTSGTFTLDHTIDTAVADAMVNNLYETALGRAADPSGLATNAGALLNGTMTQAQIAASLIGSSEFATKYGTMSNADFVSQIFANGLGRLPTTAEAQYWTGVLNSGAVSQPDFVAAMAQSPDHLQTENQQVTTLTVSGTGNIIHASGDTLNFTAGSSATVDSGGNTINFTAAGLSDQNLWFLRSGNDLQIDVLGTSSEATVTGWFASSSNPLVATAGGLKIDSQIAQLVQAMATYSANHPGFNPTAVAQAPNDSTLQNAIAAAWHN